KISATSSSWTTGTICNHFQFYDTSSLFVRIASCRPYGVFDLHVLSPAECTKTARNNPLQKGVHRRAMVVLLDIRAKIPSFESKRGVLATSIIRSENGKCPECSTESTRMIDFGVQCSTTLGVTASGAEASRQSIEICRAPFTIKSILNRQKKQGFGNRVED